MPVIPSKSYLICATPRSGSTLLCEALRKTRLAGNPDEYFGPMHVSRWNETWKTRTDHEYFQQTIEHGCTSNGDWGAKVMRLYWQDFLNQLKCVDDSQNLSESELLETRFPGLSYIFITRRNKVRQAVSWLKFIHGSAWFWEDDAPQKLDNLEFKPDVIDDFLRQTTIHESAWLEFFERSGIQPRIVTYEDFVTSYEETAIDVLGYLGIECPTSIAFEERRLKKQADALSDAWVQKYLDINRHTEQFTNEQE